MSIISETRRLVSPVGEVRRAQVPGSAERTPNGRPDGIRLGFLSNTKANTSRLQAEIARTITAQPGTPVSRVEFYEKQSSALGASAALLAEIARDCTLVINGTGECGGCSAWSTQDTIALERAGVKTLTICTTPFEPLIRKIAEGQGQPGLELGVIGHPVGGTSDEVFAERVREASALAQSWLLVMASRA